MEFGKLIGFKKELFFEGAVQLRWSQDNPTRAKKAAESFVFHGPHYHGVSEDSRGVGSSYRLKDTATFILDLVNGIQGDTNVIDANPLLLAVAGYGSGKSHLALTAAQLLSAPQSKLALDISKNIFSADPEIGRLIANKLILQEKPVLVVTIDGMSNFHLGNELNSGIIRQLKKEGADLTPIHDLSPRFQYAADFVQRNYKIRKEEFQSSCEGLSENIICEKLLENDEYIYESIDDIYLRANGTRIPVDGRESSQDLINTVCDVYCGESGVFSSLLILFDEFGRYLEYAAEKPNLAGDSSLQQIFQGIQDNNDKAKFVGFIQYELKAYLNRFNQKDLLQLQRYITRFDSSEKIYLSTNLETLFAHLIEKIDPAGIEQAFEKYSPNGAWENAHNLFSLALPGFTNIPVWGDFNQFQKIIVKGCWPLHPLTTWFLTRQQDIVQSRSALTFIKDAIDSASKLPYASQGKLLYISPAELVLKNMLPELVAADRAKGGAIAETLMSILEKYKSRLTAEQQLVLAGVLILDKMRVESCEKNHVDQFLCLISGLAPEALEQNLTTLSQDMGAVEWNSDLAQYELIVDAATKGQFQLLLNRKINNIDAAQINEIFIQRASNYAELTDIKPDFAEKHNISSSDWIFRALLADSSNYEGTLSTAVKNWRDAIAHDDPKGQVVYILLTENEDIHEINTGISLALKNSLGKIKAPIWIITLHDRQGKISEGLARVHVVDEKFSPDEREKFRRFIPEERQRSLLVLKKAIQVAQRDRIYNVAGIEKVPDKRLNAVASWIFEQVYPKTISFPFDGFHTKTGTGPKECMSLIRALVTRQVSGDWISLQGRSMQNRATRLLAQEWKVLGSNGTLLQTPENEILASLLRFLEETHRNNEDRTLGETYLQLTMPPYGFNASSAGVVLGLILAQELPPRALKFEGVSCSLEEWLVKVLPNKKGKNSFDLKGLKKTNLIFLEADATQRWNEIILRIEHEKNYSAKVLLLIDAEKQENIDPIPESLLGRYSYAKDKAKEAEGFIIEHNAKVDELERSLERAEKQDKVESLIYCGGKIAKIHRNLVSDFELWTDTQRTELANTLLHTVKLITGSIESWVNTLSCNNLKQVADFRRRMDGTAASLKALELLKCVELVEDQKNRVIAQVDKRTEYEMSVTRANDIVRMPPSSVREKLLSIKSSIEEINSLIKNLKKLNSDIRATDIKLLISKLESRKIKYEHIDKEHRNKLAEIYNYNIENLTDVEDLLARVKELRAIFSGTRDENDVVEIFEQLEIIKEDMNRWSSLELSPEELDSLLDKQIKQRVQQVQGKIEAEGGELFCDLEGVYTRFKDVIINQKYRRSSQWFMDIAPAPLAMQLWTQVECERQIVKFNNIPVWTSSEDRSKAAEISKDIDSLISEYKNIVRLEKSSVWLSMMNEEVENIKSSNVVRCENLLGKLNIIPEYIDKKHDESIDAMRRSVSGRIDEMNIDDIFNRICNLSERMRVNLVNQIKSKFLGF